tara:strand:- start:68 stop:895 length:828 start_codon:yes stop_codon:yes gene_type:complete
MKITRNHLRKIIKETMLQEVNADVDTDEDMDFGPGAYGEWGDDVVRSGMEHDLQKGLESLLTGSKDKTSIIAKINIAIGELIGLGDGLISPGDERLEVIRSITPDKFDKIEAGIEAKFAQLDLVLDAVKKSPEAFLTLVIRQSREITSDESFQAQLARAKELGLTNTDIAKIAKDLVTGKEKAIKQIFDKIESELTSLSNQLLEIAREVAKDWRGAKNPVNQEDYIPAHVIDGLLSLSENIAKRIPGLLAKLETVTLSMNALPASKKLKIIMGAF